MHGGATFADAFNDELMKLAGGFDAAKKEGARRIKHHIDLAAKARGAAGRASSGGWAAAPPSVKRRPTLPSQGGPWNVRSSSTAARVQAARSRARQMRGTNLKETTTVSKAS